MHRTEGLSECVLRERQDGRSSLCVIGGRESSIEVFDRASTARRRALQIQSAMLQAGWRQSPLERPARAGAGTSRSRPRLRLVSSSGVRHAESP